MVSFFGLGLVVYMVFWFGLVERQPNMDQKNEPVVMASVWLKANQTGTKNRISGGWFFMASVWLKAMTKSGPNTKPVVVGFL